MNQKTIDKLNELEISIPLYIYVETHNKDINELIMNTEFEIERTKDLLRDWKKIRDFKEDIGAGEKK